LFSELGESKIIITSLAVLLRFWWDLIRKNIKAIASPSRTKPPITTPIMPILDMFEPWFLAVGPGAAEFVGFPGFDVLLGAPPWQVGSLIASKWTELVGFA
jgi:hypothetical protein